MGASFRTAGEIKALAGCDLLTIGPKFLEELKADDSDVPVVLTQEYADSNCIDEKLNLDENTFRFMLNEDAMATEKLAEGIRGFCKDINKLEESILSRF